MSNDGKRTTATRRTAPGREHHVNHLCVFLCASASAPDQSLRSAHPPHPNTPPTSTCPAPLAFDDSRTLRSIPEAIHTHRLSFFFQHAGLLPLHVTPHLASLPTAPTPPPRNFSSCTCVFNLLSLHAVLLPPSIPSVVSFPRPSFVSVKTEQAAREGEDSAEARW